jgi:hypothetical protein
VNVLSNMVAAVKPGGLVFDLQVIRPNPVVEADRQIICEIDGEPLFRIADAAAAAIDAFVARGRLVDEAVDDHDVREHYVTGAELIGDFVGKRRQLPVDALPTLRERVTPCLVRERCRLRRLGIR